MLFLLFLPMLLTCTPVSTLSIGYKLKSVHVVFRHGDSVIKTLESKSNIKQQDVPEQPHNVNPFPPNDFSKLIDPNHPHEFDPHSDAELTNAGKMRSYKLGQFLRSRYSDFLGMEYERDNVYARSSYQDRARASLLLVLAGLYPPSSRQRWNSDLDWQPIGIESPGNQTSDPLMWPIDCPAYVHERKEMSTKLHFVEAMDNLMNFFVLASNVSSLGRSDLSEQMFFDLYKKLRTGKYADVPAAKWADVYIPAKIIRNAAVLRYHTENYNNRLRRLNGGMLMKKIVDDMKATIKGDKRPKINLYGGQEFNVVALLWALDAWKPYVPTYSTAVIVELLEMDSYHYVRILYHNGYTGETETRAIDGCKTICAFEDLEKLRHEVLPLDAHECFNDFPGIKKCAKNEQEKHSVN